MTAFFVGCDVGQMSDYTAIAVLERTLPTDAKQYHLAVRHLERPKLGTEYPVVVERVKALLAAPALVGATLIVDATGVGMGVVDLFRQARLKMRAITITAGDAVYREGKTIRVPKRDLVAGLLVAMQTDRLQIAEELSLAAVLSRELLNFKVKIDPVTANDSYGCWRDGQHDDLVLAVALAAWYAEKGSPFVPWVGATGGTPIPTGLGPKEGGDFWDELHAPRRHPLLGGH